MTATAPRDGLRVVKGATAEGSWELVFGAPHRELGPYVRGYCGYVERTRAPTRRREMPAAQAVMIIDFGPTLRLLDARGETIQARHAGGFVAGLDDAFTVTETAGAMEGIQINFTPIGAALLVGGPTHEIARRIVSLHELFGAEGRALTETLHDARGWAARFAHLDRFIRARVHAAAEIPAWIHEGWRRIERSGGAVDVARLAKELGYSRKHVAVGFRERIGLPPKALAGLVRFERAIAALRSGRGADLAQLALDLGYYDQAHFTREIRAYAGLSPGELLRRQRPGALGVDG